MALPAKLSSYLVSILLDGGKDLIAAVAPELIPLFNEYVKERKTPDGWTRRERGMYFLGMISRVKDKQIGNAMTDRAFDWAMDALEDLVHDSMDEDEDQTHEVADDDGMYDPQIPPPQQPGDYEFMYDEKPNQVEEGFNQDDVLWFNKASLPEAQRWIVLPPAGQPGSHGYPGWTRVDW